MVWWLCGSCWIVETSGKLGIRILVDETEIVSAAAAYDVDDKGIRDAAARLNFNTVGFTCVCERVRVGQ